MTTRFKQQVAGFLTALIFISLSNTANAQQAASTPGNNVIGKVANVDSTVKKYKSMWPFGKKNNNTAVGGTQQQTGNSDTAKTSGTVINKIRNLWPSKKHGNNNTAAGGTQQQSGSTQTQPGNPDTSKTSPTIFEKARNVFSGTGTTGGSVKTIDNGIDFAVAGCMGDRAAQTVTVSFTFSNPRKVHQAIWVGAYGYSKNQPDAFDQNGNKFSFGSVTLAQTTNKLVTTELPTNVTMSGNITFTNVLPSTTKFNLINIPAGSSNWTGGGDKKEGVIEVSGININWRN